MRVWLGRLAATSNALVVPGSATAGEFATYRGQAFVAIRMSDGRPGGIENM